ncbi:uroporphyrinogen-III synthase [Bermanella marisrubri]|uniref:Uroporphyrinogen-III synthase n=1 Tax=Bermanella marisrubri TaxID=207949 RepID=Q1MZM6_9GAMM|nr:uroporphyrinogen-III synthase [Bermanella marisrubri]EAT11385.1 uroporphyrinogen-III synthetase [Oceanobacter sp. RED65] [Bermanella marisrubri]QIZ85616.1 uroporphyrinogen-III synthase [Bermanella marisrubri]
MDSLLVTRPQGQGQGMMIELEQAGIQVVHQPLLKIEPLKMEDGADYHQLKQRIVDLDLYDTVICVSSNAAQLASDWIDQYWPQLPVKQQWFAVGPSSAEPLLPLLDSAAMDIQVPEGNHSEGLLALPQLRDMTEKKVLILRGVGGRELIKSTLEERGASVHYAEFYRRTPVDLTQQQLQTLLTEHQIHYALLTSGEMVQQFHQALPNTPKDLHLLVPSERIQKMAIDLGFQQTHICQPITAQAVLKSINDIRKHR